MYFRSFSKQLGLMVTREILQLMKYSFLKIIVNKLIINIDTMNI